MADALVHLITPDDLAVARRTGHVAPPSLDEQGFVHLCAPAQLGDVIRRHGDGWDVVLILELDPSALAHELRWEESHPGEHYPHLYGPLPLDAVVGVTPWRRMSDGTWPPAPTPS